MWKVTQGTIKMETPLRIGKQIAPYSVSSAPVLLQYDVAKRDYMPFIPGSSLKGVLRSSCERILRSYGETVCDLPVTCGECQICNVFGAQEVGAKIRVRDCKLSMGVYLRYTEEKAHYADRGGLRYEEDIPPFCFDLHIDIANATEEDIALVLLGLDEFNHKRAHVGGGVSRGLGFASVEIKRIIEKRVDDFRVNKKDKKDIKPLNLSLRPGFKGGMDFSCYWRADDNTLNGCIVCELEAESLSEFMLRGVDEERITVNGTPVIPGSVLKGFLRKHFIKIWDANKIDDVFGSTRRAGHRSRVLVSDAFPTDDFTGVLISEGTTLTCWMVFDNMLEKDIRDILNLLKEGRTISGNTSAMGYKQQGEKLYNRVKFVVKKPWKFTLDDPKFDVTMRMK